MQTDMIDMEDNIAYNYDQTRTYETIQPEPTIVPALSENNAKKKHHFHFNIFITLLTLITFVLTLSCVVLFIINYTSSQFFEPQQSKRIDNLMALLNSSYNEFHSKLYEAQDSIQVLQQQNEEITAELHQLLLQNDTQVQSINFERLNISRICSCNSTGEWTSVANLDMTNSTQQCPPGFKLILRTEPPFRVCGRPDGTVGCVSAVFPVLEREYSRVCGRIIAYQVGSPSGFINRDIDRFYVAGISLTHGQPRQHIWSFVNALSEGSEQAGCPCTRNDGIFTETVIPSFVEDDYFCDTGVRGSTASSGFLYPNDPLWDGQGCGTVSTCCEFNTPPWFCKQLPQPTTDNIEMRLCEYTIPNEDDSPFKRVEIYIS